MLSFPEVIECPDEGRIVCRTDPASLELKTLFFKEVAGVFTGRLEETAGESRFRRGGKTSKTKDTGEEDAEDTS